MSILSLLLAHAGMELETFVQTDEALKILIFPFRKDTLLKEHLLVDSAEQMLTIE